VARYSGPVCRLCRREGIKLFLKGERCYTDKCAIERRSYPPGQHGQGRGKKATEYSIQLREKQKLKRIYGSLEKPFRRMFASAERGHGVTGENLLLILERRLDNTVYRMGFATSRSEARQLVRHGHFLVNNHRVTIPSYTVSIGDEVQVKEASRKITRIQEAVDLAQRRGVPEWLEVDKDTFLGKMRAYPARADITVPVNEQLIVELYSKV
jgi:small subunit ribosomal protein S4